ncbi:T9SS type A sorting domain-containing protein [candidate division KSB1 bacterium]|nr:T9SS type A sorting domain-containing protein [candidate division KSB1 bacterium]
MNRFSTLFIILLSAAPLFSQGYLCVVGGGSENYNNWSDIPYRWMVEKADKGPVLVMHYSDGSSWLENYFKSFGAQSAGSLVISNRTAADDSANYKKIIAAKMVFLRGGGQENYYNKWNDTLVEQALIQLYQAGGVIGGTSAGLAVLGGVDYSALTARSVVSASALRNPFYNDVTLTGDFLPLVPGVIFDSHFTARGRIGRLMAFVGHWNAAHNENIIGIGVDERTAFCIEPDGEGMVAGAGAAFIIHASDQSTLQCEPNQPLFFTDWTLHALTEGFRYNVRSRQLTGTPDGAQSVTPSTLPDITDHAMLFLNGGKNPSDARASLQQIIAAAGDSTILLLSGTDGTVFLAYLQSSLNAQNIDLLTLSTENMDAPETADKIRAHNYIIVAGFTTNDCNTLLAQPGAAQDALKDRCRSRDATMLFSGPAASLLGSNYLQNPDSADDDLQEGRLSVAAGMDIFPNTSLMHLGFYYDDYIENRVGGLFWLLYKNPFALGLLLDGDCTINIEDKRLIASSPKPVIVVDAKTVSVYDTSDYRYRSYYQPRQTAAFYGAAIHCLPANEEGYFDLEKREWMKATGVPADKRSQNVIPDHFQLDIYPNPALHEIHFQFNQANPVRITELAIYNIRGQIVAQISDPFLRGSVFTWDGITPQGRRAASGTYILRCSIKNHLYEQTFVIVR